MKKLKAFLITVWDLPLTLLELEAYRAKFDSFEKEQQEIKKYLGGIAALAEYVKEKDDKSDELFQILATSAVDPKSQEELAEELDALDGLYVSTETSQAIGRYEIEAKNRNLIDIQVRRNETRRQLEACK